MRITESRIRRVVREETRRMMREAAEIGHAQQELDGAVEDLNRLLAVGLADIFGQRQLPSDSYYEGSEAINAVLKRIERVLMRELSELYADAAEHRDHEDGGPL